MVSLQPIIQRSLAMLLPACFVWTLVACMVICMAHASELQSEQEQIVSSLSEAELLPDTECCPFQASQLSVLPEQRSNILPISPDQSVACMRATEQPLHWLQPARQSSFLPLPPDPPLERLCSLRI
jgi:hypothetical protein